MGVKKHVTTCLCLAAKCFIKLVLAEDKWLQVIELSTKRKNKVLLQTESSSKLHKFNAEVQNTVPKYCVAPDDKDFGANFKKNNTTIISFVSY